MNKASYEIRIDVRKNHQIPYIELVSDENKSRQLNFSITNQEESYNLTNLTAKLVMKNAKGETFQRDLTVTNAEEGKASYLMENELLETPGVLECQIVMTNENQRASSHIFKLYIRKALS